MWGVGDKSWDSSLQEGVSHTYTLKLDHSRIFILYNKKKKKKKRLLKNLFNYVMFENKMTCSLLMSTCSYNYFISCNYTL